MGKISFYRNVKSTKSENTVDLLLFLDAIKTGKWQDQVIKVRTITDKELRRAAKIMLPNVTISGIFGDRIDTDLKTHSGFIAIDIDDLGVEVESTKDLLKSDPYVFSAFTSVSGFGLCVIIKIDGEKHREAFDGIADYLIKKYQIIVDPTGVNPSRTRFVSFDPYIFQNEGSISFKKYLPKPKKRKINSTIFVQNEFDEIINKMVAAKVSCVEDYRDWRDISFGLADKFGESGRNYFHILSSVSGKYEATMCNKQYTHALARNGKVSNKITIATIYHFAKMAGINIFSEKTKKIAAATSTMKKAGLNTTEIAKNLEKFEGIKDVEDIINEAFKNDVPNENSLVDNIRMWLRHNYNLKLNLITRKIENDGKPLEEVDFNTMFLDAFIIFEKLSYDLFIKIIFSHNTQKYNPLKDFITSIEWDKTPRLNILASCINSNTGTIEWRCAMVRKWMVGVVSSVFGFANELNFILVGAKNTGKTKFFTNILPKELMIYFGRSQLNRGNDDKILMCEKLIILNDEYGGKNKTDARTEKGLMASPIFNLRVPYGKGNEDVVRIASLCGTCNEIGVLDDDTGNRRIIIMESVGKFDYNLYNSIDKSQLIAEAYAAFLDGELPELNDNEINMMEKNTDGQYSKVVFEGEMIQKYFLTPEQTNPWDFMTATEIKLYLESYTRTSLNIAKIGSQLKKLGYTRSKNKGRYGYDIQKITTNSYNG